MVLLIATINDGNYEKQINSASYILYELEGYSFYNFDNKYERRLYISTYIWWHKICMCDERRNIHILNENVNKRFSMFWKCKYAEL